MFSASVTELSCLRCSVQDISSVGVYKLQLIHYPRIHLNVSLPLRHSVQQSGICFFWKVINHQETHFWNLLTTSMIKRLQNINLTLKFNI
jgi:hypothetical protein